jgi:hypothetical protein
MRVRISEVDPDRIPAVLFLNLLDAIHDFGKRFVPGDRLPTIPHASYRLLQAVGVVVEVFQRRGLRANVTSAEDVSFVAAYRHDFFAVDLDLDSAHRFAEVASSVVGGGLAAHLSPASFAAATKRRRRS